MTAIFHHMMHKEMKDYVDDIMVKSKTRAGHFQVLERVFERCMMYKLCMNPMKCAFGVSTGKFLGFLVYHRDLVPQDRKSVSSGYLHIPKAKTILFSPSNPPGDQVSSHKGTSSPSASPDGKNNTVAGLTLSI